MTSLIKNFVIVLLAMLVGAATVVGYLHFQPPATPMVASAATTAEPSRASLFDEDAIASIYDQVSPAVVYITSQQTQTSSSNSIPRLLPQFPQLPQTPQPSVGTGSGVIIDDQGHILTNNHVVEGADKLTVTLSSGKSYQAKLLGRDPGNDLAVIQIDAPSDQLTVAPTGDSSKLKAGYMAIAIGNPFGLDGTITVGVISSVGRTYTSDSSSRPIRNMIQTDAAINPGNSGGPLLNSAGEVVGITTAIESPVRGSVGVGFAVPVNTAMAEKDDLIAGKTISHPWLGISGMSVTDDVAQQLGVPAEGVYVVQVMPNSPAQDAGLKGAERVHVQDPTQVAKGGDVILSVDGQKVSKVEDISAYLDTKKPGDKVTLNILRDGANKDVEVTLGDWPDSIQQQ